MDRLFRIQGHLSSSPCSNSGNTDSRRGLVQSESDVVIVSCLRSAIARARKGSFANLYAEELLTPLLQETLKRTGVAPEAIQDLVVGTVLGDNNQRANEMRIAQLMAGIPASVPMHTLNRQCSSGLQAIAECAANIKAGFYDVALACGVEHMSSHEMKWKGSSINPNIFLNEQAKDILMPMGVTSENVASDFKISRHEQDELAVRSHALADAAIKSNRFSNEIVPIMGRIQDEKTREMRSVLVSQDEGVRLTSLEGLAKLKPAFDKSGSTTAGNASQVSDGAAVSLVCSRKFAREHKLPVLGIFKSFAVAGCPPRVMGIGPVFAIPAALKKANLTIADIDLFEINEAFASQACYVIKHLGIPLEKVNVNGGAIALGHPLGCTGVRMTATLLHEMHKRKARYGVVSMCIGGGMGAAAVYERQ